MSFEQVVRIPVERVGVIIGRDGSTKKTLEEELSVQLVVDSKGGTVVVESGESEKWDPDDRCQGNRGNRKRLLPQARSSAARRGSGTFELVDLRDYAGKSENSIGRIRGRVIGLKGKSRRVIEDLTHCYVSVYGRTVAIIGEPTEVQLALEAVKMLASGSQHRTVYNMLQKARTKRKMERMFLWEGSSPEAIAEKLRKLEG